MKKQALIHVHGLLVEVSNQYDRWDVETDMEDYKGLGTKPTSIHKSKTAHKEAVFELVDALTEAGEGVADDEATQVTAD